MASFMQDQNLSTTLYLFPRLLAPALQAQKAMAKRTTPLF
jgi:hypothetical protein